MLALDWDQQACRQKWFDNYSWLKKMQFVIWGLESQRETMTQLQFTFSVYVRQKKKKKEERELRRKEKNRKKKLEKRREDQKKKEKQVLKKWKSEEWKKTMWKRERETKERKDRWKEREITPEANAPSSVWTAHTGPNPFCVWVEASGRASKGDPA